MISRLSRSYLIACAVLGVGLVVAGCASSVSSSSTSSTVSAKSYYLSLGDSYSVGYQPAGTVGGVGQATSGYTAVVAAGMRMQLKNFGCGGATTTSLSTVKGCTEPAYGPVAGTDAVAYPNTTQTQAALDFISAPTNHGKVGLVTVSIGGNDVTACVKASEVSAILACVNNADGSIKTNVSALVSELRSALKAAGDQAPVVGLTYPDVVLGEWVYPQGQENQQLASLSVSAFDQLINPALEQAYGKANFVNVTVAPYGAATSGANTPLGVTVHAPPPYGQIPAAVGEICDLTYYCTMGNIHANTKGYTFIGKLILAHLGR
jgi:lysophospholipase L1-like esterase